MTVAASATRQKAAALGGIAPKSWKPSEGRDTVPAQGDLGWALRKRLCLTAWSENLQGPAHAAHVQQGTQASALAEEAPRQLPLSQTFKEAPGVLPRKGLQWACLAHVLPLESPAFRSSLLMLVSHVIMLNRQEGWLGALQPWIRDAQQEGMCPGCTAWAGGFKGQGRCRGPSHTWQVVAGCF